MADEQISIVVGADVSGVQSAFDKARAFIADFAGGSTESFHTVTDAAKEHAESVKESFDSIRESVNKALEVFLVYEGLKFGKEMVFSGVELADQLYRTNVITGISVQELQRLKFAAEATGGSFEQVTRMIEFASRAMLQLRSGQGGQRIQTALGDLGLKASDLGDNEHLLEKLADGLDRVHNSAQKIGDLRAIFGRMGAEALPMLANLRELEDEFKKLGFAVDDAGIAKAWAAGEAWNKLGSIWEFVKLQLSADLAQPLEAVAEILIKVAGEFDAWLKTAAAADFGKNLTNKVIDLAEALETGLVPAMKDFATVLGDVGKIIEAIVHPLDALGAGIGSLETSVVGGSVSLRSIGSGLTGGSWFEETGNAADKAKPKLDAFGQMLEEIRKKANEGPSAKILEQFKGSTGAPATGGPPLTAAEKIQEIAEAAKAQESALSVTEALNKQKLAYGQESASQEIAQEQNLANQKYNIQLTALQKELAVQGQKPVEHAKILAQITELENSHSAQMVGLATKLTEAQNKEAQQRVEGEVKSLNQVLEVAKAMTDLRVAQYQIDAEQAANIKSAEVSNELGLEKQKLEGLLQNNQLSLADRQKYTDQIRDIDNKLTLDLIDNQKRIVEEVHKTAEESAKAWQDAISPLSGTLNGFVDDWLTATKKGTQSMHQVMTEEFRKTLADMVKSLIASGITDFLVGGGKAGTISGDIFGTSGGGANVEHGTKGVLGLGGGLAGLLAGILPGGPGGIIKSLLGQDVAGPSGAASLTTAGTILQTAAAAHQAAALALQNAAAGLQRIVGPQGVPNTLPPTSITGPGIPPVSGASTSSLIDQSVLSNSTFSPDTGIPVYITGKESDLSTNLATPSTPTVAGPLGTSGGAIPVMVTNLPAGGFGGSTAATGVVAPSGFTGTAASIGNTASQGAGNAVSGALVSAISGGGVAGALRSVIGSAVQSLQGIVSGLMKTAWQGLQGVISGLFGSALKGGIGALASGAGGAAANAAGSAATSAAGSAAQSAAITSSLTLMTTTLTSAIFGLGTTLSTVITTTNALIVAGITGLNAEEGIIAGIDAAILVKPSILGFTFARGGIVPSAAGGMVVGGGSDGVPSILHPREMVLPARISEGIQRMVAAGGGGDDAAAGAGAANGGAAQGPSEAGDFHLHYSPTGNAIDSRGMHQMFKEHAKTISDVVIDHLNRRGGRYPKFGAG